MVRTGQPAWYEDYASGFGKWFETFAFKHSDNRFALLFRDVTDRKRAEEALRESEARLRAFVTASFDTVYRMSADWTQMERLSGRGLLPDTPGPTSGWLDRCIPPDEQPRVTAAIREAVSAGSFFELEHRDYLTDGSVGWALSRAVPVRDASGAVVEWLGTATDATPRRQAEEQPPRSEA